MKNLYSILNKKKKEIKKTYNPVYISQNDFKNGTLIIDKPGHYILKESIIFSPNQSYDYMPRKEQQEYNTLGFSLGFFAVISIYAEDVYLNLNGFTISASNEFVLQQRFFSIIELANSPFIPNEGPGNFSTSQSFKSSSNVIIRNGNLGLSSHHGIHGNMAKNILLENINIENFEFVGIALNGCDNVICHRINIKNNRKDIPVSATYSAARFIRLFAKRLLEYPKISSYQKTEIKNRLNALEKEMSIVFRDVMERGKTSSILFQNKTGLPDGNIYGFLAKNKGFAVNEFISEYPNINKSYNIYLKKVNVENLECKVDEILALSQKNGVGAQIDAAGAVLQIDKIRDENNKYIGNVLSNLQIYLAEISMIHQIPLGKNNICSDVIEWSKGTKLFKTLLDSGYFYKTGGDSMLHYNKGAEGFRFDAIDNIVLKKCSVRKLNNHANLGIRNEFYPSKIHDTTKRLRYIGADTYGIHFSFCSGVKLEKISIEKLNSKNGNSIGIDFIFNTDKVYCSDILITNIKSGNRINKKWRGDDYFSKKVKYEKISGPLSIGIKYESKFSIDFKDIIINNLISYINPIKLIELKE